MNDLALFSIGTVVFFLGGLGIVLYGLESFRAWNRRSVENDGKVTDGDD